MATVTILLYRTANATIALKGDQPAAGQPVTLQGLEMTFGADTERMTVRGAVVIPAANVAPVGAGPELQLVQGPRGLTRRARLRLVADGGGAFRFFRKRVDASVGLSAMLVLRVPPPGSPAPSDGPFASISCRARVELSAGGAFATADCTFEVAIEELPTAFPSPRTPSLRLLLPGDVPLPSLSLPWSFPVLPDWPLRAPALSLGLSALPVRVGWKAVEVNVDGAGALVVRVQQLRLEGGNAALEADLTFTLQDGQPTAVKVQVYRPDFGHLADLDIKNLLVEPGCVLIEWTGTAADELVRLVTPELGDAQAPAQNRFRLRILGGPAQVEEIRLDWLPEGAATPRKLQLPGFTIDFPAIRWFSLVARGFEGQGETARLTLAATLAANGTASAKSSFTWARNDSERELHRDATGRPADPPLVEVGVTARNPVTVVLADLPLETGGAGPRFFQQLDVPLDELTVAPPDTDPCAPSRLNVVRLRPSDWMPPTFTLNLGALTGNEFRLPFLNRDGQGLQFLSITRFAARAPDFTNHRIGVTIGLRVHIGPAAGGLDLDSDVDLDFDWERFAFDVAVANESGIALKFNPPTRTGSLLGLNWTFRAAPDQRAFLLVIKGSNYRLQQAPGAVFEVNFDRLTSRDDPIVFRIEDFALTPKGIDLTASVTDRPAKLNGLETQFRFTQGKLQIREGSIRDFAIAGTGPLPPALVGNAMADIALQFSQRGSSLELVAGSAQLKGAKLLRCEGTRFEFAIDALGLKFVNDGGYHLYFTLSGKARYAPLASDDRSGPLAWLPKIELQLIDCPLTGNAQVIARHVNFLVELPRKVTFDLLGCFKMELRGLALLPRAEVFANPTAAMQVSGQVKFADTGDVLETKIDFHNLYIGLPRPGSVIPQLHLRGLGVRIKSGEAFELYGAVDFLDNEEIEPGLRASGFTGEGSIMIQGLPQFAAAFSFIRVSNDAGVTWRRAWFLYLEAGKLSLMIPVIEIYIREIGVGFGYRYTLAMIRAADEINDPKKLLRKLKELSLTQGNLAGRESWRVDLEAPGEGARWTVALRALISQTSAAAGLTDWNGPAEETIACLFVMDAVIALRSDLTFLMAARAWLNTNYNDFLKDKDSLRSRPLLNGFVLLSPRQKRFLANLSSNANAAFGGHPPLPGFLEDAIRDSHFSATLLIEPGLVHYELGWPNQLRWRAKLGPLEAEFSGGTIFRLSTSELVVGNSFLARGKLDFKAEVNLGIVGASLGARADVAYGARYIGVLSFRNPFGESAFYGAVGVEIRVVVTVEFWIKIPLVFTTIEIDFSFQFALNFTAALEVGITLKPSAGVRGTATIGLSIMGHDLHFGVRLGLFEDAVNDAARLTGKFLSIGLEAEEVEPVPGTQRALVLPLAQFGLAAPAPDPEDAAFAAEQAAGFEQPDYVLSSAAISDRPPSLPETEYVYLLLLPAGERTDGTLTKGFLPPPPADGTIRTNDLAWRILPAPGGTALEQFRGANWQPVNLAAPVHSWQVDWDYKVKVDLFAQGSRQQPTGSEDHKLSEFLRYGYMYPELDPAFGQVTPVGDPILPGFNDRPLSDERVQNPSDSAFEAAVRGAAEQFAAAPYFKRDRFSEYENTLLEAYSDSTSIYSTTGTDDPDPARGHPIVRKRRQAKQLRGAVLQAVVRDFQRYTELAPRRAAGDQAASDEMLRLERQSLAFRFGLIFRASGPGRAWLVNDANSGRIRQRANPTATAPIDPDGNAPLVRAFNTSQTSFGSNPPAFNRVKTYAHAQTIALAWELVWTGAELPGGRRGDPGHHLKYYRVHRVCLDAAEPEVEYTVKKADLLHRQVRLGGNLLRLLPRFQVVDHFNDETAGDLAALTEAGKTYLYTVTPIDLAGQASPRPLSLVVTRYPSEPPQVPTDGELLAAYGISDVPAPVGKPALRTPDALLFSWTPPATPSDRPPVGVRAYRLIFRRENALPVGFFGSDADTRGGRAAGLPTSNARPLRTDLVLTWRSDERPPDTVHDPDGGRDRAVVALRVSELEALGVLPSQDGTGPGARRPWRPEAWRIFVQTESTAGVRSPLAPVALRLRFAPSIPDPTPLAVLALPRYEERHPPVLEWVADPVRFDLLPPVDEAARDGFAQVPMPDPEDPNRWIFPLADPGTPDIAGLRFAPHPDRLRAIRFTWNQGPTDDPGHPLDLHARFYLYEFDADAHPGEVLDPPPNEADQDFGDWERRTGLRRLQEAELLPPDDLPLVPADTLAALTWEAWYPSAVRRVLIRGLQAPSQDLPARSQARYSPWYSFRESYLDWPEPGSMLDVSTSMLDVSTNVVLANGQRREQLVRRRQTLVVNGSTYSCHPFLARVVTELQNIPEPPPPGPNPPPPLPLFTVELNPLPPALTGDLASVLKTTPSRVDPYGWGVLQRMGLAVALRLRKRRTGEYVLPGDLYVRLRAALATALTAFPAVQPHLHVEHLFQPGKRLGIGRADEPVGETGRFDELLALVQLSLRPVIHQRLSYGRTSCQGAPGGPVRLRLTAGTGEVTYLERTGTPSGEVSLPAGQAVERAFITPPSGEVTLLFRGPMPLNVTAERIADDGTATALPLTPFAPTAWESTYFAVPDEAPWRTTPGAQEGWRRFGYYLQALQPPGENVLTQPGLIWPPPQDVWPTVRPDVLSWLGRFFDASGDVNAAVGTTGPGPWMASAYPRAATPIALAPDAAGRLEYTHLVEDPWAHTTRYFLRPQGRYDLLWAALAASAAMYGTTDPSARLSRLRAFRPPAPGGLDVVLDRVRPLEAPLVLSSRRIDPPAKPGQPLPPGATWEIVVAKHPEQALIEANRPLAKHLAYRQVAFTLLRQLGVGNPYVGDLQAILSQARSALFPDRNATPVTPAAPPVVELVVGAQTQALNLTGHNHLDGAAAAVNGAGLPVVATVAARDGEFQLSLASSDATLRALELRTAPGDPRSNLLSAVHTLNFAPATGPLDPALPAAPGRPDHLDFPLPAEGDDALSLDLPKRLDRFGEGFLAFQWQAEPYYYVHRVLLVAQAAAVVSPVTAVEQRDFHYRSPAPKAVMEGVLQGGTRFRRVTLTLRRFWDCLGEDAQRRWATEDPGASPANRRLHSSLPDPDVIYQLVVKQPSGLVEVLSELRFAAAAQGGYEVRQLPSRIRTTVVRLLPPADGPTAGANDMHLEVLLRRVSGAGAEDAAVGRVAISTRSAFAATAPANPRVSFPPPESCVLRLRGDVTDPVRAALMGLIQAHAPDVAFTTAVRQLLSQDADEHGDRTGEASLGLEQLVELTDGATTVTLAARQVRWQGAWTAEQQAILRRWVTLTPYRATIQALLAALPPAPTGAVVDVTVAVQEADWQPRPLQVTLPLALRDVLLVGHGVIAYRGLMTREEGQALRNTAGLTAPDQRAIERLFEVSLGAGLEGGQLTARARRGFADLADVAIAGTL